MKNLTLLALFISLFSFAQTKKVSSSEINWWGYKVAKTESSSHTGTIGLKSGNVVLKGNKVVGGSFVFDMNSINATDITGVRQQKLNEHLKSGDFFEIEKFPTGTFIISGIKPNANPIYNSTVSGKLTLKGKTNTISFPAKITVKNGVVSFISDKFSFDRQKFGVSYNSSMKDVFIKDEVDMQVKFTAQ